MKRKITVLLSGMLISNGLAAQNVGIGTAAPQSKLHVAGSITADTLRFNSNTGTKISLNGPLADHQYTGFGLEPAYLRYQSSGASGDHVFMYGTSPTSSRELMRIRANGRIGIGTASPAFAKLVIAGQPGEVGLDLATTDQYANLRVLQNNLGGVDNDMYIGFGSGPASSLHLFSDDVEALTLKNGRVGIGTGNAAISTARLVIGGPPDTEGLDLASANQYANLRVLRNSLHAADKDMYIGFGSGTSSSLHLFSNNLETVTIKNGNVGIGVTNPRADIQLDNITDNRKIVLFDNGLNNNHQFNGFGTNTDGSLSYQVYSNTSSHVFSAASSGGSSNVIFRLWGTGNATLAGTLTQNSDARLKTNIQPIESPLQLLQQLNGYTYHWKDAARANARQTGLLAQEVQKIYPELVTEDDKGLLSVNYIGLIPVLLEGIKDLTNQNRHLQAVAGKLEKRIQQLEKKQ